MTDRRNTHLGDRRIAELVEARPETIAVMDGWTVESRPGNDFVGWTDPTGHIEVLALPPCFEFVGFRVKAGGVEIAHVLYEASDAVTAATIAAIAAVHATGGNLVPEPATRTR